MNQQRRRNKWQAALAVIRGLGWPLLLGMAAFVLLIFAIRSGPLAHPLIERYLVGHWISYCSTAMFCVGFASLAIKAFEIARQYFSLDSLPLDDTTALHTREQAQRAAQQWDEAVSKSRAQGTYLAERVADGLEFLRRRDSADGLAEELKYLAESDSVRAHESYALSRIVIWATPMLGFLGTVIGISEALGSLSLGDGQDFDVMLQGLRSSLYVAFDTTAQALSMSIVLMFVQFLDDRFEGQLLGQVDRKVTRSLLARAGHDSSGTSDPIARSIERSTQALLVSVESLVERQAGLWADAFLRARSQWEAASLGTAERLQQGLSESLEDSLDAWRRGFAEALEDSETRWQSRWEQMQVGFSENARRMQTQQQELARHGELLERTLKTVGEVTRLETSLERNLERVAEVGRFEEAISSLCATIHLLNGRLGRAGGSVLPRSDWPSESQEKAA